jgi:uncharacterized protein (TIGR03546 family)
MTLILKQLFAFLRLLNSETGHNQLAAGLACGIILGFSPFFSLQTFLIFFLVFFFRIQFGAAMLSAFVFKFIAYLVDPVADLAGRAVLESEGLRPLFVKLYNMPIVPMTRFNNSIVMGSFIIGALLAIPGFFIFKALILKYRTTVLAKIQNTKVWKAIKATKFYNWYLTYEKFH